MTLISKAFKYNCLSGRGLVVKSSHKTRKKKTAFGISHWCQNFSEWLSHGSKNHTNRFILESLTHKSSWEWEEILPSTTGDTDGKFHAKPLNRKATFTEAGCWIRLYNTSFNSAEYSWFSRPDGTQFCVYLVVFKTVNFFCLLCGVNKVMTLEEFYPCHNMVKEEGLGDFAWRVKGSSRETALAML